MKQKKTKKSHYIPEFYLKRFADCDKKNKNCKFWVYDVKKDNFFQRGPGGIFFEKYFYGLASGSNDELAQVIEKELSKSETKCAQIFKDISQKVINYQSIDNDLIDDFIDCAISIFTRTKDFRDQANFMVQHVISKIIELVKQNDVDIVDDVPVKDLENNIKNIDKNNLEFFRQADIYGRALDILKIKKMTFYIIPESNIHSFFIGNQPFLDIFKENAMIGENNVLVREQFFVLHPKILVRFSFPFINKFIPAKEEDRLDMFDNMKKGINFKRFKRKRVENDYEIMRLNNKISLRQYEFLIHRDKEYIEKFFKWIDLMKEILEKYKNYETKK